MNERQMFEKSFQRPWDFYKLSPETQWAIDKQLGILDWIGDGLSKEDKRRYDDHYKEPPVPKKKLSPGGIKKLPTKTKKTKDIKVVNEKGFRVRDLIKALKKMPQDRPVKYLDWQGGQTDVEVVQTDACTFMMNKTVVVIASKERMKG